jgi:hypothetical protein
MSDRATQPPEKENGSRDPGRETPVPLANRHPPIWWATRRFQFNLDALREILNDILPTFGELDDKHFGANALVAIRDLPEDKRADLQRYIDERIAEARAGDPPAVVEPDSGEEDPAPGDGSTIQINFDLARIEEIFGGDRHFLAAFFQEVEHLATGPRRVTIMHNSLLTMAIGAFEVLIASIATQFYVKHPGALDSDEKVFSFEELRKLQDVDDAADDIISRRITDLMYGDLDSWSEWFSENAQQDISELAMDFDVVSEAFQRRHVVLHNGGLASRQYLSKTGNSLVQVGDRLPVNGEYLNAVFDQLDTLGTSLGILAEGTWSQENRDFVAETLLLRRCFELMMESRWEAAQTLAALGQGLKCKSVTKSSLQCNEWLCRAERFGYESVREVVTNGFDTSDMAPRFELARKILIEDIDGALASIPELIASQEITRGELEAWPILRTVREHADYTQLLASIDNDGSD